MTYTILAMSTAEVTAVASLAIVLIAYLVASLRFIYRMEARITSVADGLSRVEGELHGLREDIKEQAEHFGEKAESVLVLQESVRNLVMRVDRIEGKSQ